MPNYRRFRVRGSTYYFTVNLAERGSDLLVRHIDVLRVGYRATYQEQPFVTQAIVVMPDHIHAIWTLPEEDADFSNRWRKIKARFSHAVGKPGRERPSLERKREVGVWQRRFWEHRIHDAEDFQAHMRLCLTNPVHHGLVQRPEEWPYSSLHRDLRAGRVLQLEPAAA